MKLEKKGYLHWAKIGWPTAAQPTHAQSSTPSLTHGPRGQSLPAVRMPFVEPSHVGTPGQPQPRRSSCSNHHRAPIKPDLAIERGREPFGARTVAADVPHRHKLFGDQGGTSGLRSGMRRVYVG